MPGSFGWLRFPPLSTGPCGGKGKMKECVQTQYHPSLFVKAARQHLLCICLCSWEWNKQHKGKKTRKVDDKQQCSLIGEQILSSITKNRVSTGGKKKLKKNKVQKIWMHAGGRLSRCVERRRKKILDWTTEILDWPCMRLWSITLSEIQTWEYVIKESFIAAP